MKFYLFVIACIHLFQRLLDRLVMRDNPAHRYAPEGGAVFDDMQAHDCDPNDPMDVEWYQYKVVGIKCKDCGAKLQLVRPGKVQCPRRKN